MLWNKAEFLPAVAQTQSGPTAGTKRDQAYVYISAWPANGIKAEVSVSSGFVYRRNSIVKLTVGLEEYTLFTATDRAYVADPTTELRLIDAMKKGSAMLVEGIDERGMRTTDLYSLGGLSQTLQAIRQNCG